MHRKKRKLFVLYSIPIWFRKVINSFSRSNLCKEKLYLVSYSIPLKRMGVLLLTGMMCSIVCSALGNLLGIVNDECYAAASATLELGASNLTDEVAQGSTAYASSTIKASGNNDIGSYTLSITGPVQLSNGTTKLNGANGKIGSELEYNTWGYSYNEGNKSNENKTYKSFTGSAQELAKASATTGNKVTIDSTAKDITFAARFADDAATGEYKATVTISLVASPMTVVYRLTYDANGGNTSSVPSVQSETNSNDSHSFNIASAVPTRTGYTFQGWSETSNSAVQYTANGASGTSKTITLQKSSPTKTLYAVWKATGAAWSNGISSGVIYMQDVTSSWVSSYCGNASGSGANAVSSEGIKVGDTLILKDTRTAGYSTGTMTGSNGTTHNLNEYVIVKLEDGNCWMQENLRLKAPSAGLTLTSDNSDVNSWHMPATLTGDSSAEKVAGWVNDYNKPYSAYFSNTTNGVYYNWTAAIAMADSSSKTSGDVNTSICPKGWKLPTGTEYDNIDASGANSIESSPYYFVAAGLVTDGDLYYEGGRGAYWSRTTNSDEFADHLSFFKSRVDMSDYTRGSGYPVRCVAAY